jgi:hypothetical protein
MTKPSEEYTIHILEDEDFDKLPFGEPRDAMGMTNAKIKTAWVRKTGVKDMDMNTIRHEFDELMQGTSLHEIDGIRYKGGKSIFRSIFNFLIPGSGSLLFGKPKAPTPPKINFQPQQASQAFAPAQAASPSPLSQVDFDQGLSNIDANRKNQTSSVFSRFRGLGSREQNTAFDRALGNVETSSEKSRQQFIDDQEERKRIAGL